MSNKIRVLTNISASQNVIVSGSTVISGSKLLATTSSFNNSSIVTSSDGFYNMNSAIHGLDTGITTLKNNIKTAYNSIRAVLTGALDSSGNKKINLTSTIPSGSLYFTTASLTSVGASLLIDTESDNAYKNDLVSFQLFNSASYLWAEIDAPAATNDYYRLIVVNHGSLPIGSNASGGGNENGGGAGGGGGGGGGNLFIIAPIVTPTGSVVESVSGAHEGYYIYSDVSGNVTITINDFSASTSDGGISFYAVSNNYTGSITYDDTTDVITSNEFEKVITITGDVNTTAYNAPQENTLEPLLFANPSGQEGYDIIMPNLTSSIINDGNNITVTIPVGTGSSVYVDTYSNTAPTTYDFNWSGGIYNNSGSSVATYVPTFVTGGYWVPSNNNFSSGSNYDNNYIPVSTSSLNPTRVFIPIAKLSGSADKTVTPISQQTPTGIYIKINSYIHSLRFFSAYNPTANINDFSPGTNAFGEPTVPGVGFDQYGNFNSMSFINYMSVYSFDDSMYYTTQSSYPIILFVPSRNGVAKAWITGYPQTNPAPVPGYTNGIGNIEIYTA